MVELIFKGFILKALMLLLTPMLLLFGTVLGVKFMWWLLKREAAKIDQAIGEIPNQK